MYYDAAGLDAGVLDDGNAAQFEWVALDQRTVGPVNEFGIDDGSHGWKYQPIWDVWKS
jgi:hypothetical protein